MSSEYPNLYHQILELAEEVKKLLQEVERLTEQCRGLAQAAINNGQELLLQEAEIERLNDIRGEQDLEINKLRGEIERLKS